MLAQVSAQPGEQDRYQLAVNAGDKLRFEIFAARWGTSLDGVLVWVNPIHEDRNRAHLDALLRECDIVSIHCPLNADSRNLIDARSIARLRPHVFIINTSRGGILDENALVAAGLAIGTGSDADKVFDALTHLGFWLDDAQVVDGVTQKRYATHAGTGANLKIWRAE